MSSEIRAIAADEVPLLLPGARAFFAECGLVGKLKERYFVARLSEQIAAGAGVVFTADFRGAIGGVFYADPATSDLCCMEYFWYVHPQERGSIGLRLLAALEAECVRRGAKRLSMMHLAGAGANRYEQLYQKRGYHQREQVYVRAFE